MFVHSPDTTVDGPNEFPKVVARVGHADDRAAVEGLVSPLTRWGPALNREEVAEHGGMDGDDAFVEAEGDVLRDHDDVPSSNQTSESLLIVDVEFVLSPMMASVVSELADCPDSDISRLIQTRLLARGDKRLWDVNSIKYVQTSPVRNTEMMNERCRVDSVPATDCAAATVVVEGRGRVESRSGRATWVTLSHLMGWY